MKNKKEIRISLPDLSVLKKKYQLKGLFIIIFLSLFIASLGAGTFVGFKQKNEIKSLKNQLDTLRSIAKEKDEQVKQQNEKLKQQGQVIVNIATFSVLQDDLQNTLSQVTYDITQYTTEQENAASAARQAVTEIAQALSCLDTSCLTLYFQRVRDQLDIYDKSKANGEIILVSIEKSVSDFSKAKEALENFLLQTQSQRN
ncbi:hypothetical protein A2W45_02410 [Candidatus Curtissbacteria bacterium RIFCSPHIGHO2_12_41_11]|uniref:Uncharacterized protein n=4 Tax=Candidatus Curtissiibacteriota TaxID=1752717 RepID=A0A1F5HQU0_9BACT|nr:MAG: hypothetical protein UT12_C0030G0006 [Candidatus Curtissbacteria bacterium GW2011_GWC2_38_9]KKS03813.1 MAG: hypothetical protein UU56_C0014G0012 [Candidatus Curtissbacteria bacterium GW2011_GWA2_41_24]OGD90472.1 MAG: hypothetical protein A2Z54_01930 [Candidatus Curtissbacteria bacterium RIFCSPHIGHO2_02_39_8]OGD99940.1 MAG: hypothetical protein A2W45_02410 [Candidatus Curtissbacteria bacterium RIFCSPHIGHO2_12_41_11]OGE06578.1 MAG: hypothetical protein A2W70_03900 [Candidatus Curtissbacte